LVQRLIGDVLQRDLPGVQVIACAGLAQARQALAQAPVDLVTTALSLHDGDGLTLAREVRATEGQAYVPVIVVSADAQQHLERRLFNEDITDYFDKALGHQALAAFISSCVRPAPMPGATVLYAEDSQVVATATRRMLERQHLHVLHVDSAEAALALLTADSLGRNARRIELVLTDVTLSGELGGRELIRRIRVDFGYGKRRLPVLVMTGDSNAMNQAALLRSGANDLVLKPIDEHRLSAKVLFQLRLARLNPRNVV